MDGVAVLALVFSGLIATYRINSVFDLSLYDETWFLLSATSLKTFKGLSPEAQPLYIMYYYALSLLEPNRYDLFYLNVKLLGIVTPIVFFAFLRRNRVSTLTSLVFAAAFMLSNANLPVLRKSSLLTTLIMILALTIISFLRHGYLQIAVAGISALLMSFCRPEYALAYCIFSLTLLLTTCWQFRSWHSSWHVYAFVLGVYALASCVMIDFFGLPTVGNSTSGRAFCAFCQHFAANWVALTGDIRDPWDQCEQIIRDCYGNVSSISEALIAYPRLLIAHICWNLSRLFKGVMEMIHVAPRSHWSVSTHWHAEDLLILAGWIILIFRRPKFKKGTAKGALRMSQAMLLMLLVFSLPSFFAGVIIYPNISYLRPISIFTLSVPLIIWESQVSPCHTWLRLVSAAFVVVSFSIYWRSQHPKDSLPDLARWVVSMNHLEFDEKAAVVELGGGVTAYLNQEKYDPLLWYSRPKAADLKGQTRPCGGSHYSCKVVVCNRPCTELLVGDPEWDDFLRNHAKYGFTGIQLYNSNLVSLFENKFLRKTEENGSLNRICRRPKPGEPMERTISGMRVRMCDGP